VDWTLNIGDARHRVDGEVALQGNLDPTRCSRSLQNRELAGRILDDYGAAPGHIFNLGHGILRAHRGKCRGPGAGGARVESAYHATAADEAL